MAPRVCRERAAEFGGASNAPNANPTGPPTTFFTDALAAVKN